MTASFSLAEGSLPTILDPAWICDRIESLTIQVIAINLNEISSVKLMVLFSSLYFSVSRQS